MTELRVGVIGPQDADSFADNICDSLESMDIPSVRLGPAQARPRNARVAAALDVARKSTAVDDVLQRRVARRALEMECSVVLTVEGRTSPQVIADLEGNGVRTALWFPDPVSNIGRAQMLLAPYSAMFFKEPRLVDRLAETLGLPVYYMPEACNARWHRSDEPHGVEPVVVIAGTLYPTRLLLVERLLAADIPIRVYGPAAPRWVPRDHPGSTPHAHRAIHRHEKARVYRRAAAVLNNLRPGEIDGVNCRLFEATGSGAVVLAENRRVLPDLFDHGELLVWSTFDQLIELARNAVDTASAFAPVGDRAAARAHSEHTYERRLTAILEILI